MTKAAQMHDMTCTRYAHGDDPEQKTRKTEQDPALLKCMQYTGKRKLRHSPSWTHVLE